MMRITLIYSIVRLIKLNNFKRKWREHNKNNGTIAMKIFDENMVSIGMSTYGELNVISFNNKSYLKIGNFCSIAQEVYFLLDVEHCIETISSYPFKAKILDAGNEAFSKGDIVIEDDVWIGFRSTILSGVHIGQGAVVAAGSVVTKDVPPYAIVGGVPAKVIKYRFSQDMINKLMNVDYSKLTYEMVKEHIEDLYKELIDVEQLDWMPKKQESIGRHEKEK